MSRGRALRTVAECEHEGPDFGGLMPTKTVIASRSAVFPALALTTILVVQVAVAVAAGPQTYAAPQGGRQQLPTPAPLRFLTPLPRTSPSTSTTTTTPPTTV